MTVGPVRISGHRRSSRQRLRGGLARPGGNATGFMNIEYGIGGKWLELLKEIAPNVTRVAIIRDTANPTGIAVFGVIQAMAPSLRVEATSINMRDAGEAERLLQLSRALPMAV